MAAAVAVLDDIHARFQSTDFGAGEVTRYGVLIHQIDFNFDWRSGLPWMPKMASKGTARGAARFLSASFIFRGMHTGRHDRATIPVFGEYGGIVIRAEKAEVACSYGVDGATWNNDCDTNKETCVSGCGDSPDWCSHDGFKWSHDMRPARWREKAPEHRDPTKLSPCFSLSMQGQPRPWQPEDLGFMLEQYNRYTPYRAPGVGMHSGYNEVVLSGAQWMRSGLPRVVQAFFMLRDEKPGCKLWSDCQGSYKVREAHAQFLRKYRLTAADVPLLRLRTENWRRPFELVHPQ